MTKTELLAPGSPKALKLRELKAEINKLHEDITISVERVRAGAKIVMANVALAGKSLLIAKATVRHGEFMDWLSSNCPTLSYDQAAKYMVVARNWESVAALEESTTMREALLLCSGERTKTNGSHREPWPAYLEGVRRITRVMEFVEKHPVTDWPDEGRDELKIQLEPVARALWPEKFTNSNGVAA